MFAQPKPKRLKPFQRADHMPACLPACLCSPVRTACLSVVACDGFESAAESLEFRVKPLDAEAERAMQQLSSYGAEDTDITLVIGAQLAEALLQTSGSARYGSYV